MWYTRPIDVLSHYDILSQDWKVFQDVIINCMEDLLYCLTSDVLESPCTISTFDIAGGVSFLLVLHLWYGGMQVVHQDVRVLVLYGVPYIMIKKTSLGNIECWPLWDLDDKIIFISAIIGHRVIFLDQAKVQDVCYFLGVIPHRIRISREITNIVDVCHS